MIQHTPLLQLKNISMLFNSRLILKNINLSIFSGTLTLITGANGSGKSTLLRLMARLLNPTQGEIIVNHTGMPAYIGHESMLYHHLSALENLQFFTGITGSGFTKKDILAALYQTGLAKWQNEKTAFFSRGMLQKMHLARILLSRSSLILLDEPFSGLDTEAENFARNIFLRKRDEGCALVMVSHYPEKDQEMANTILRITNHRLESIT